MLKPESVLSEIGISQEFIWSLLGRRAPTVRTCYQILKGVANPMILELGTTRIFRSVVIDSQNYCSDPSMWDWGAGCFTVVIGLLLPDARITSVDPDSNAMHVSRTITEKASLQIDYHQMTSSDFLANVQSQFDLIYMDHAEARGDDSCAILHRNDADLICSRKLLADNGLILIDDVDESFGKGMYSIPLLTQLGFSCLSAGNYQAVLRKDW